MGRPLQLDLLLLLHEVLDQQPQLLVEQACSRDGHPSCRHPQQEASCSGEPSHARLEGEQEQEDEAIGAAVGAAAAMAATMTEPNVRLDLRRFSSCHEPFAEFMVP